MTRADLRVGALTVLAMAGAGVLVGVLWWWVAPQPGYRVAEDGLLFLDPQPQAYVAGEGWFTLITAAVGVVAGATVWFHARRTPWGGLVGLVVGGLAGAGTAVVVGTLLGRSDPWAAAVGSLTQGPLAIHAWGVVLVEAGVALLVWLLLDLLLLAPGPSPSTERPPEVVPGTLSGPDGPQNCDYGAARDL